MDDNGNIVDFNGANATDSFNFKTKTTGQTAANNNDGNIAGRIDVEIMVPLKYLSNFWRTLQMPLINRARAYIRLVRKLCYNFKKCCKSGSYIYNNRDKPLCSSSYFINSRKF